MVLFFDETLSCNKVTTKGNFSIFRTNAFFGLRKILKLRNTSNATWLLLLDFFSTFCDFVRYKDFRVKFSKLTWIFLKHCRASREYRWDHMDHDRSGERAQINIILIFSLFPSQYAPTNVSPRNYSAQLHQFARKQNKTAGYLRHNLRSLIFVKKCF